jgi:hypothetical protein
LVLRNPLDREVAKTPGVALGQLFGSKAKPVSEAAVASVARLRPHPVKPVAPAPEVAVAPPPPPPVKKEEPFVMEIISGSKKNQAKFEASGEDR